MSWFPDILRDERKVEATLSAVIFGALIYCAIFAYIYNYLPQPFFYEPADTFADWFNTSYWARNLGTYDTWATLYPPLSFVFLRFFGLDSCYPTGRWDPSAGLAARDCDWFGLVTIFGFFLLNLILIYATFRRINRRTALPRTICLGLGWPMLDGLERGNLVLVSFTCLLLWVAPLLKSSHSKAVSIGLAVNFKVYLIAAIVPLLLRRRWRFVEQALIAVVLVYLASYALLGRGTIPEIVRNIGDFASNPTTQVLDLWYSSTYKPAISLLEGNNFPVTLLLGSQAIEYLLIALKGLILLAQCAIMLAVGLAALRPEVIPPYRFVNLGLLMALITSEAGGYTPVYWTLLVLMEPWRGLGRKTAIVLCYVIAIPLDIPLYYAPPVVRDTYFGNSTTIISYAVTVMPFVRPALVILVAVAISSVTIRQVWGDIRVQGWSSRRRFRRDAPVLPGVLRPPARAAL
jgi:hypothetical protein